MFAGKTGGATGCPLLKVLHSSGGYLQQGILTEEKRVSTLDLLIKINCFVKKVNTICNIKRT
jgi:hypothetical protein